MPGTGLWRGMMRGQLALEYLVLSLVALALIAASLSALSAIRSEADRTAALLAFRSSSIKLESAMGEACALGDGNARVVYLESALSGRGSGEGFVILGQGGASYPFRPPCEVGDFTEKSGKTRVENIDGRIVVG